MNLRTWDKYFQIEFDLSIDDKTKTKNIGLNLDKNNTLIILEDLLSETDCQTIINETSKYHTSLENEFIKEDRQSFRLLNFNKKMADIIYDRINKQVEEESKIKNLRPFGFGVDGTWYPVGINHCFRHSYYEAPSIGFSPHRDAAFVETRNTRSALTLIIYLNDNFSGGKTTFLKPYKERKIRDTVNDELKDGYEIIYSYTPKTGSAIVFNHDVIHAGEAISDGTKHIIRSDIVFRRDHVDEELYHKDTKLNPLYHETIELYREAGNQEMSGNIKDASLLYEKGLALRQHH